MTIKNPVQAADLRNEAEELRAKSLELVQSIEASGEAPTDEQQAEIDTAIAKIDDLHARAEKLDKLAPPPAPQAVINPVIPTPNGDPAPVAINFKRNRKNLRGFSADSDGLTKAYKAGQWVKAAVFGDPAAAQWCIDNGMQAALSGGDNNKGGVLVPDEMSQAIIDLREEYGVFRRESRVVSMGSDTLTVPRRTGGLTAYAVGENDEITASDKSWDNIELVARKWGVICKYSSELSDDAVIDLADDLAAEIAYAFANKEDESGFNGDGTSTYHGINGVTNKVNLAAHAGSVSTAASGNTAFSTLDLSDFNSVVAKLPLYARRNAKWYISAAGHADSMSRLQYAGGGNTVDDIAGGSGPSFLGYPVVFSQVLNSTLAADTSAIKLLFGDLSMATMMGSRRDIRFMVSADRYFEQDQLAIKGTQRYDISVHDLGTTTAAGPVVALKTPAS